MPALRSKARLAPGAAAAAAAALAVGLALLFAGGPSEEHGQAAPGTPGSQASAAVSAGFDGTLMGAPLQRARCEHWLAAGPAQRLDAVRGITANIGGPSTSGGVGTTLTEADAVRLFDRTCATPATRGFALYLIYARAAAFSRVNVQPPAGPNDQ